MNDYEINKEYPLNKWEMIILYIVCTIEKIRKCNMNSRCKKCGNNLTISNQTGYIGCPNCDSKKSSSSDAYIQGLILGFISGLISATILIAIFVTVIN